MANIPNIPNTAGKLPGEKAGGGNPPPATGRITAAERKDNALREDLAQLYTLTGVMVGLVRSDIGTSIIHNGEDAADAWVELAAKNPRVRKALEDLTAASVWGAVVAVHVRMLMPAIAPVLGVQKSAAETVAAGFQAQAMDMAMEMMAGMRGTGEPAVDTVRAA